MSNEWIPLPIAESGIGTPCLICGETVTIHRIYDGPQICDKCKKAVIYMRERMEVTHEQ